MELKTILENLLRDLEDEKKRVMEDAGKQYDFLIEKIKIVLENVEKGDKKAILGLTCYNNIAYCCGLEKECLFRDIVLSTLGISKDEYKNLKDKLGEFFVDEHKRSLLNKFLNEI